MMNIEVWKLSLVLLGWVAILLLRLLHLRLLTKLLVLRKTWLHLLLHRRHSHRHRSLTLWWRIVKLIIYLLRSLHLLRLTKWLLLHHWLHLLLLRRHSHHWLLLHLLHLWLDILLVYTYSHLLIHRVLSLPHLHLRLLLHHLWIHLLIVHHWLLHHVRLLHSHRRLLNTFYSLLQAHLHVIKHLRRSCLEFELQPKHQLKGNY